MRSGRDIEFLPSGRLVWLFWLIIVVLRLVWPGDIEWKADEKEMLRLATEAIHHGYLPGLGMKSGIGLINAGFSVWPFVLFANISTSPVFMSICVMVLNILALMLMWHSANFVSQKHIFRAGILLAGVNVMAVIFSRKIWAQDLIPVFMAAIWFLFLTKKNRIHELLIGIFISLAGQLHLSGFFFGFGFITALYFFRKADFKTLGFISLGCILGLMPALHWVNYLLNGNAVSDASPANILKLEYFLHLATDITGLNVHYSLGNSTISFIKTYYYLPLIPALAIVLIVFYALWESYVRLFRRRHGERIWRPDIAFIFWAFVLFPGIFLTLSGTPVRSHYLIGCLPFAHIALSSLVLRTGKKYYWILWTAQLCISIMFMIYIHTHCDISGDYGTPLRCLSSQP